MKIKNIVTLGALISASLVVILFVGLSIFGGGNNQSNQVVQEDVKKAEPKVFGFKNCVESEGIDSVVNSSPRTCTDSDSEVVYIEEVDSVNGYRTYTNEEYGFMFAYPEDWGFSERTTYLESDIFVGVVQKDDEVIGVDLSKVSFESFLEETQTNLTRNYKHVADYDYNGLLVKKFVSNNSGGNLYLVSVNSHTMEVWVNLMGKSFIGREEEIQDANDVAQGIIESLSLIE